MSKLLDLVYDILLQKRSAELHQLIKLKWKKAQLEKRIKEVKA